MGRGGSEARSTCCSWGGPGFIPSTLCGDSQWSVITVPEEQMKRKLTLKWVSVTNVLSEEPHLIPTARTDGQCN